MNFDSEITIYHNPDCSKSCSALELLQHAGNKVKLVNYIEHPLTEPELKNLLNKLGMKAEDLLRKKEKFFLENFEGKILSEKEWFDVLLKNQYLMERPIAVKGEKAIIARPPEKIKELFD